MADCSHCTSKLCRTGNLDAAPDGCPCRITDRERELERYDNNDKMTARESALVESYGYGRLTRMEEIMEYAIRCGYNHLGLAFCVGLSEEAKVITDILQANGFKVDSACCKCGSVPKAAIGISPEEYAGKNRNFEAMCNPAGQAAILDEAGCQLNIICGLCVGHDTLFIKHCKSPVTVLAAKDRVTGHNPLAPIYNAKSYRSNLYRYVERRKKE